MYDWRVAWDRRSWRKGAFIPCSRLNGGTQEMCPARPADRALFGGKEM